MKVLVTGANGQLAFDLMKQCKKRNHFFVGYDRAKMDVTDPLVVNKTVMSVKPDVVIHCAAYTNVDKAEAFPELAHQINGIGTEIVASAAEKVGAKLVYISTDYIFDGEKKRAYENTDIPNPINVYGCSKLLGEQAVQKHHTKYFIIRTSWLYGIKGDNFVKTILSLANEIQNIPVVYDQIGSPTSTSDLAERIVEVMESRNYGIYHISNSGFCSWYEFSKKIVERMEYEVTVSPIKSSELLSQAKRPSNSVLCNNSLTKNNFKAMRPWGDALNDFLITYMREGEL